MTPTSTFSLDYTLLDPDLNESELPAPPPDPRDWEEHCEACRRLAEHNNEIRCRCATIPIEIIPTDDAPLSSLEPFWIDNDCLARLDGDVLTVGDARQVIADKTLHLEMLGPGHRRKIAIAVARADKWLAENH